MEQSNNILIVYYSVSGLTQKYARWLSARLNCPAVELKDCSKELLDAVSLVVFFSRFMAGKIDHLKAFEALAASNKNKEYMLAITGAMPSYATGTIQENMEKNLKGTPFQDSHWFYLPSGLSYENLPVAQRLMLKAYAKVLNSRKNLTPEEKIQADMISSSFDQSDQKYLDPLVKAIKESNQQNKN